MLYGHIEKPEHVVDHLIKIRELQKKTNGFITLIPLKFSLDNTELEKEHKVTHESSSIYDLKNFCIVTVDACTNTQEHFCILGCLWNKACPSCIVTWWK
ncbi:MAG: hypothetical protein Ct9H300mP17_05820 [Candidatus Nitrosopelagicus sp.]|nr:MAG: hypothetical protein Ct9H300mP17_05820 [Candidatus Nitrosopelagicus sp.]